MTWQQTIDDEKEDAYEEGYTQGIAQGASQKAVEDAENLLRMGMGTDDQISMAIGLPLEQVKEIAERIGNS